MADITTATPENVQAWLDRFHAYQARGYVAWDDVGDFTARAAPRIAAAPAGGLVDPILLFSRGVSPYDPAIARLDATGMDNETGRMFVQAQDFYNAGLTSLGDEFYAKWKAAEADTGSLASKIVQGVVLAAATVAGAGIAGYGPLAAVEATAPTAAATTAAAEGTVSLAPSSLQGITLQSSGFGSSILSEPGTLLVTPSGAVEAGATTPFLSNAPAGSVFSLANATPSVSAFNLVAAAPALPSLPTPQAPSSPTSSPATSIVDKAAEAVKSAAIGAVKALATPTPAKVAPKQQAGAVATAPAPSDGLGLAGWLTLISIGIALAR